ncbi:hypothetical protein ALC60_05210, partial [Trachymyrmex zeteki]
ISIGCTAPSFIREEPSKSQYTAVARSCFAFEIENSVSSWLLRSNVNGDFSGRDIRSDLDIPDGARPEEQAFHITGNREVQLNAELLLNPALQMHRRTFNAVVHLVSSRREFYYIRNAGY